jgi:disulfide bond formation protein DsbB
MISKIYKAAIYCPHFILMALGGISLSALLFALISQYGFGLHPCDLCLYQRIPYAVVILLAIIGVTATKVMGVKYGAFNIALCALAFFINSGIGFYHIGVEEGWWVSGCSLGTLANLSTDELMESINNAPTVSCSAKPWELFGITMAGYNFILCLCLGIYALIASITVTRKANGY